MEKRLLIIEDSESVAELERRHLERDGFTVSVAASGFEALELLRTDSGFDILVIDYKLPDMSGAELMQMVKELGIEVPSVIVTAAGSEEVAVSVMKLGAMDYIVKDRETIKNLGATCTDVIRRYGLMRENEMLMDELKQVNTDLTEANQRLEEITKRDDLTGIYNRRHIMESLYLEVLRAKRYRMPLSFAIFDLDHFKKINDSYGHTKGDLVLQQFADVIGKRLRRTDMFGRYGGEEFAIVITQTELDPAVFLCDSLREIIARTRFGDGQTPLQLTTSAGVASFSGDMKGEDLIELADRSLYVAKEEGRNRVVAVELRDKESG
jgi:diguanylate cyclase (GGDEF)-like protein